MSKSLPFFRYLSTSLRQQARLAPHDIARLNQAVTKHGFQPVISALHQRLKFITDVNGVQNPFSFGSDTGSPMLPEILSEVVENSLSQHVQGFDPKDLEPEFNAIKKLFVDEDKFADVKVFPTSSTSQANKLAINCVGNINPRIGEIALATMHSHIFIHEVDQPAVKIMPNDVVTGKMTVEDIMRTKAEYEELGKRVKVIHIDQPTNGDHYYMPAEIRAITDWAHSQNMAVTMDCERLINYLPICGKTYRDFTIDCGVDVITFGMQKNGGPRSSAVIVLNDKYLSDANFLGQRVCSFMKAMGSVTNNLGVIMSGWQTFLDNNFHLYNATKANKQIDKIADFVKDFTFFEKQNEDVEKISAKPLRMQHYPLTSNMLFAKFPRDFIDMFNNFTALYNDGALKHFRLSPDRYGVTRIVASHDTSNEEVQNLLHCLHNVYTNYAAQKGLPCDIRDVAQDPQVESLDFQEKYGLYFNPEIKELVAKAQFNEVIQMTAQAIKIRLDKKTQEAKINHKFTSATVPFDSKVLTVFCTKNAGGYHTPYGDDEVTYDAVEKLRHLFNAPEAPLSFTSSKAQATNCVTQFLKASNESQILVSQGSFAQHCAHDRKVMPMSLSGENKITDKLDPKTIDTLLSYHNSARGKHTPFLAGVMLNQPTSSGHIYSQQEIKDIVIVAHKHHVPVVMELNGFAYHLARTGQNYADYTTECGVDVVTLGLQGVGGALSSVCIVLDRQLLSQRSGDVAEQTQLKLDRTVKANGGRNSDSSSLASGWSEMLAHDHWRSNANKANAQMDKLNYELRGHQFDGTALEFENFNTTNNIISVKLPKEFVAILNKKGYDFGVNGNNFTKIMVHYHVSDQDVEKLIADFRESYEEYTKKQTFPAPKPLNPKGFPHNLTNLDRGRNA